jgi:hypothetical protein
VVTRDPNRRTIVRAAESATVRTGEAPSLRRRAPAPGLAASVVHDSPAAAERTGVVAETAQALHAAATDSSSSGSAGTPLPLAWNELRHVGTGTWIPLADGARQSTPSTEYEWDYAKGSINMGQMDLRQEGSLRARLRVRPDGAPGGKWNVAATLKYREPNTATCSYSVRGAHRVASLEFHSEGGPTAPWTFETFPRTAGPVSFEETYWIEVEVQRAPRGLSTIDCRIWADGASRPESFLRAEVELQGPAAWLGFRTYRTTATFDAVEVTPLPGQSAR